MRLLWKQRFPEIFHCIEYSFYIQDFWATCACPEKQNVPWNHCIDYIFFIIQNFEQPALALEFFTVLKYFLSFRIFVQLELALKTEFDLNFSSWGGFRPPSPRLVRHCLTVLFLHNNKVHACMHLISIVCLCACVLSVHASSQYCFCVTVHASYQYCLRLWMRLITSASVLPVLFLHNNKNFPCISWHPRISLFTCSSIQTMCANQAYTK